MAADDKRPRTLGDQFLEQVLPISTGAMPSLTRQNQQTSALATRPRAHLQIAARGTIPRGPNQHILTRQGARKVPRRIEEFR